jgi:hypothetical protein
MSDTNTAPAAPSAAEQSAADAAAVRERTDAAARDAAELDKLRAEEQANRAASIADAAAERAESIADENDLVEININPRRFSIRSVGGGTRHYGPGRVKVPRSVAEAYAAAPTFATSGNALADRAVRRTLERDHGVVETNTTEATTARTVPGAENDGDDENGERLTSRRASRAAGARSGGHQRVALSESEIDAKYDAEQVERLHDKAVREGKVKPITSGSGAEGNVLKSDRVAALAAAGYVTK